MRIPTLSTVAALAIGLGSACDRLSPPTGASETSARAGAAEGVADPMDIQPTGPAPEWAPDIDPQMLAVIEQLEANAPRVSTTRLSPFQFRNLMTPADAIGQLLQRTGTLPMEPRLETTHRVLPVGPPDGILVRTYTPLDAAEPLPVVVYYHGGGWVIGDLDAYDTSARALAEKTDAIVVSVAYRLAPEQPFPTAHEDAFAAYQWVTENTIALGGDTNRVAVAGESAGGNLAVGVAMMARDRGAQLPVHVLAVYPIADGDVASPTYDQFADALPLDRPMMEWFFDHYLGSLSEPEPLISLVDADLVGLPPMTIINAEIDPLRFDGLELTQELRAVGVPVQRQVFPGVTHEFFGMSAVLEQAVDAQDFAARRLRNAFGPADDVDEDVVEGDAVEGG